jgi:L-Ala-D/L-Glu epimerase
VGDVIERVELIPLRLPYRSHMQFRSSQGTNGTFVVLRLTTRDGVEGLAEATALPSSSDSDPRVIVAQLESRRSLLVGVDPFDHQHIAAAFARIRDAKPLKSLIDVALWDLKGKLLGMPVWRMLGGGPIRPVPVTAILFGDTPAAMLAAAERAVGRGFRSLKVKVWRRSFEDIKLVAQIRKAVGDEVFLYVDANQAYSEIEARAIFPNLAESNVALIEDPCDLPAERLALLAQAMPATILGDIPIDSLASTYRYLRANALGAVSLHIGRTGISETIKIATISEAAGISALVGTDLEASIGALARLHLWIGVRSLQTLPAETQFFDCIASDVLAQPLSIVDGTVHLPDGPGFGATIDEQALRRHTA